MITRLSQILCLLLLPVISVADTWQTESSDRQVAVIELFTAEGCGLCPAADRWVHSLPKQGITNEEVIVLGFHIDYLNDKKAWVDRFASKQFSDRQRQLAQINLYKTIYTPEFVVSGEVVHNYQKHVPAVIRAINAFEPEAHISLRVNEENDELVVAGDVAVTGKENQQFSKLYLAVTENDIKSKVGGGDNVGVTFNHQNLVRTWLGPFDLNEQGAADFSTRIQIKNDWNVNKMSVIALVQNLNDGFVLQSVSLPLSLNK